jgi:hypothetical protein
MVAKIDRTQSGHGGVRPDIWVISQLRMQSETVTGRKIATLFLAILVCLAVPAGRLCGQEFTATLSGVISDPTGAALPGVKVTARQTSSGLTRAVTSNGTGNYSIPALPVGTYEVTAELSGFDQKTEHGVTLAVAQEAVVNMSLTLGNVKEDVTVAGDSQMVNTTMSSTSGLIRNQQISDLPLNGRSFLDLVTLNTGSISNRSNTANGEVPSYSIGGTRPDETRVTINGTDYVGQNTVHVYTSPQGMSGLLLGLDGVQEFNVLGSTYGAEYGKRAGGQITIVSKSGTNQWHGAGFEYLRNNVLDTRNYFDAGKTAPFQRNQFGGIIGGPIRHNKMFIFGNYEGFRQRLGSSYLAYVPDSQVRQGKLPCYVVTPTACGANPQAYVAVPNGQAGMLKYFAFFPQANGAEVLQTTTGYPTGLAAFTASQKQIINENYGLARFDYYISSKDTLSQNGTADRGFRSDPGNTLFRTNQDVNLYTSSTQETHIFSPTLLNIASFGYSDAYADEVIPPTVPFSADLLFVPGGNPGQITISGSGLTTGGGNPTWGQRWQYNWADDLKMTKGMHNISAGGVFGWYYAGAYSVVSRNVGTVTYTSLTTFLQDTPTQFIVLAKTIPVYYGARYGGIYAQDEMRLRPNLTVRLGLRDEISGAIRERNGNGANYFFQSDGTTLQTVTTTGSSPFVRNNGKSLWQPRVGLVWDPFNRGKTSVRAAFGITNDLIQDSLIQRFKQNPPYSGLLTYTQPLLSLVPLPANLSVPAQCTSVGQTNCASYSPNGIDPNLHFPTVQEWTLTLEQELASSLKLEIGYVGEQSYHLPNTVDPNTIQPQTCANPAGCLAGGILAAAQRATVPRGTYYVPVGTRPNALLGGGQDWLYYGTANYNALNVSLVQRETHGLTSKTSYTWAKGLDTMSAVTNDTGSNEPSSLINRFNRAMSRGPMSYVLKNQFTNNFSYRLPFGSGQQFGSKATGLVDKLIGGWQWNTIFTVASGFPISPQVGSNRSGDGNVNNPDVPNLNPNFTGNAIAGVAGFKQTGHYINPSAFLLPTAGTYGNAGRDHYLGPGFFNIDTSLFKRIHLTERLNMQFRTEVFNVMNHTNFGTPNLAMYSGTTPNPIAGTITTTSIAGNGRQIQFAVRLEF